MHSIIGPVQYIQFFLIWGKRKAVTWIRSSLPIPGKSLYRDRVENLAGCDVSDLKAQETGCTDIRKRFLPINGKGSYAITENRADFLYDLIRRRISNL